MSVKLFEIGRVFWSSEKGRLPEERTMLGIMMTGARMEEGWNLPSGGVDYFDIKGAVEGLFEELGIQSFHFRPAADIPYLHPGTSTRIVLNGTDLGVLGRLHEDIVDALEIRVFPFVCEMDFDALLGMPSRKVQFMPISKFPGSMRDIAVLLDESVTAQRALDSIKSVKDEIIKDVKLFDVYTGENILSGKKSLAFRILFSAEERTITDAEVDEVFGKIISQLERDLGAVVRQQKSDQLSDISSQHKILE